MLSEAELEQHCRYILSQRRIKNKIVILCEGVRAQRGERLSPQLYGKMEELPDANFYNACIPYYWTQKRPQFFNCGDRSDTINTYSKLLEINALEPEISFLSSDLLFALVDVDLCPAQIENYHFADTEDIFHDLYQGLCVRLDRLPNHRIWVTGFKQKEAYFINPDLQSFFDNYDLPIMYRDDRLRLDNLYQDMADELCKDADLHNNLSIASKRIQHCPDLECSDLQRLSQSWRSQWEVTTNYRDNLVLPLLAISKSKPYWKEEIQPDESYSRSANVFRDALSLEIAKKFYARQDGGDCFHYHLPCFFKYLYDEILS
jgi:hypothetical protein